MRHPTVTLSRIIAKWAHVCGKTGEITLLQEWRVKFHPMCTEAFNLFNIDQEQQKELETFVSHLTPETRLLDIGSHWGVFTLAALHYGGQDSSAICIEASPSAAAVLKINLDANRVSSRATIVRSACGPTDGTLQMLTTGAGGADYFVIPATERPDTIQVPQVSVDSVCSSHQYHPTHVKIDVEGFEEEVLIGATNTLSKAKPLIFIEVHGDLIRKRGKKPEDVMKILVHHGYTRLQAVDGEQLNEATLQKHQWNVRLIAFCD